MLRNLLSQFFELFQSTPPKTEPRRVLFIGNSFNLDETVESSASFGSPSGWMKACASGLCTPKNLRAKACESLEKVVFRAKGHAAGKKKTYPDYLSYLAVESLMKASGLQIVKEPGGSSANMAQTHVRLSPKGTITKLLGNVGNDADGQTLLKSFQACGIEVASIAKEAYTRTLRNLVLFDLEHHDRRIVKDSYGYDSDPLRKYVTTHSGESVPAGARLDVERTTLKALLEEADFVVILSQLAEKDPKTVSDALAYCITHKKPFALNPPTAEGFSQKIKDEVIAAIPYTDLFQCNVGELSELYGDKDIQACLRKVQQSFIDADADPKIARNTYLGGEQAAHITDGHEGGDTIKFIVTKDAITEVRTPASKDLVNTSGAGDTYAGTIIAMLEHGFSHHDAAVIASLLSMCTVEQPHAVVEHPVEAIHGKLEQLYEKAEIFKGLSAEVYTLFGYTPSDAALVSQRSVKQLNA